MPEPGHDRSLTLLVLVGGACSLGAEIAAARLLAPYFGASTLIWANTIAIVLVALSIGYYVGGRVADRMPRQDALRRVVLVASVMLAAIPLVAGPFLDAVVRAFDELDSGAFLGSLLGVSVLVSLPLVLLGTVTPWALKLALVDPARSGEIAGRLYAFSTVGSLLGVFASALLAIPLLGTQRTFFAFAALLAIVAAAHGSMSRRALVVPLVLLAGMAIPPGATKPADDAAATVLEERDSTYQYVRVVQEGPRTLLELNEGQAVHSIYDPATVLTDGVWDGYLTLPLTVLGGPPDRMAMLGNAAGTVSRAYGRFFPETRIDGVEIDPEVTAVGEKHFGLRENPRLDVVTADARPFLRRTDVRYDLIGVDAYRQPYIPFYLVTTEFFRLARSRLTEGGAVVVNIGHPRGEDALERTVTRTMRTAFPHVRRWAIADQSTLLIASTRPPSAATLRAARIPGGLTELAEETAAEMEPALTGGSVYTDDRAPVEWLIDSSIVRFASKADEG